MSGSVGPAPPPPPRPAAPGRWRIVVVAFLTLAVGAAAVAGLRSLGEIPRDESLSLALVSAAATGEAGSGSVTLRLEVANGGSQPLTGLIELSHASPDPSAGGPAAASPRPSAGRPTDARSSMPVRVEAGTVAVVELATEARCGEVLGATLTVSGIEPRRIDVSAPCPVGGDAP